MTKRFFNIIVDIFLFFDFIIVAITGSIMEWGLPEPENLVNNPTFAQGKFIGLTHRQWGDIHSLFSVLLSAFIIIHIMLHWKWIKIHIFRTKKPKLPQHKDYY